MNKLRRIESVADQMVRRLLESEDGPPLSTEDDSNSGDDDLAYTGRDVVKPDSEQNDSSDENGPADIPAFLSELQELVAEHFKFNRISTFAEAGVLTQDQGLVLRSGNKTWFLAVKEGR